MLVRGGSTVLHFKCTAGLFAARALQGVDATLMPRPAANWALQLASDSTTPRGNRKLLQDHNLNMVPVGNPSSRIIHWTIEKSSPTNMDVSFEIWRGGASILIKKLKKNHVRPIFGG